MKTVNYTPFFFFTVVLLWKGQQRTRARQTSSSWAIQPQPVNALSKPVFFLTPVSFSNYTNIQTISETPMIENINLNLSTLYKQQGRATLCTINFVALN